MSTLPGYAWHARPEHHVPGLDPVGAWLLSDGFAFEAAAIDRDRDGDRDFRYLAAIRADVDPIEAVRNGDYVTLVAGSSGESLSALRTLVGKGPRRRYFVLPLRERCFLDEDHLLAPVAEPRWTRPGGIDAERVVITGVIDHGINIAHERFRNADYGPRIDFAWNMGGVASAAGGAPAVPFGREWTGPEIAEALDAAGGDEARALRLLDLVDFRRAGRDPLSNRVSHGTHVLDLAAGAAPDDADAISNRIIAVDLPERVIGDTSGGLIGLSFVQALDYILRRARTVAAGLGRAVPVVLNFSLSRAGGPEGGGHIVARAIEDLIAAHKAAIATMGLPVSAPEEDGSARVEIVLPSGNRRQARGHASTDRLEAGAASLAVPWRLQPGDKTASYLEFWLPADATEVRLRVSAPGAEGETVRLTLDAPQSLEPEAAGVVGTPRGRGGAIARASLDDREAGALRVFLALAPTDAGLSGRRPAPAGLWQVRLEATLPSGGPIDAHVLRDDTALGFAPRGRQSYFDAADYERYGADGGVRDRDPEVPGPVRRDGAFNGLATGASPVVISGYRRREATDRPGRPGDWPAYYSGAPARGATRALTAAAPCDRSRTLSGILAAGTMSGSCIAMNGTSVAAPQFARAIAVALAAGQVPGGAGADRWDRLLTATDATDRDRLGRGLLPGLGATDQPAVR
ncbi:MAG: hypothetical protein AAF371_07040 [Pseudomonadota bacterium]